MGAALTLAAGAGAAQDRTETLADIRQDLTVLWVEVQKLNRELSTTGGVGAQLQGASVLERVDLLEREVQRLTALTEELGFQIQAVVKDGTNRVGDLEFRLCELEAECDLGALGDTPSLGGVEVTSVPQVVPDDGVGPQLAVGEQADFDAAMAALDAGNHSEAARLFEAHVQTYPGGPLTQAAQFHRAEALDALGDTAEAARGFLEAFSQNPGSEQAPEALLRLGENLGDLGQTQDACVTLGEVSVRFPGTAAAGSADAARRGLGCS
ncbi:MAG: tol-pal system protein YbgF [Pseudomonadota bacterium]